MVQRADLIKWLNTAYASEMQIVDILKHHVEDAIDYPEIKEKIQQHLELSKEHAEKVKKCITELGGEVNKIKAGVMQLIGEAAGITSGVMGTPVIENAIKEFATENYELALYSVIHRYAEELDETEVMDTVESILDDEMEMADWLDANLTELVDNIISDGIDDNELDDEDIDE